MLYRYPYSFLISNFLLNYPAQLVKQGKGRCLVKASPLLVELADIKTIPYAFLLEIVQLWENLNSHQLWNLFRNKDIMLYFHHHTIR